MKKRLLALLLLLAMALSPQALAHSGRTDGSGGHKDNQNKSGLGSYHYHCGGHPAHLHDGGVCPYKSTQPAANPTAKATQKPAAAPTKNPTPKPTAAPTKNPTTGPKASPTPWVSTIPEEILEGRIPFRGRTTTRDLNVREAPSTAAKRVTIVKDKGTPLEIIDMLTLESGETWYLVWLEEGIVYILARFVEVVID